MPFNNLRIGAIALVALLGAACGDDTTPLEDMGPEIDAQAPVRDMFRPLDMDAPPTECTAETMGSTLGDTCIRDTDCGDGCFCNGVELCTDGVCVEGAEPCGSVDCSVGTCDEATRACDESPDDSLCDDGSFCNGQETCDPMLGCRPGAPPFCADGNICTIDSCSDEVGACVNALIDEDGDGAVAQSCGGMDCDDRNAMRAPTLAEVCGNGVDDDCDRAIDSFDLDCAPTNDFCVDGGSGRGPLDITPTGPGTFVTVASTVGMGDDYDVDCVSSFSSRQDGPDAVFTFTLTEAQRVAVEVQGIDNDALLSVRALADCDDENAELRCSAPGTGLQPYVEMANLAAGTYAVVVITESEQVFDLALTLGAPGTEDFSQDMCDTTMVDVSAGGTFSGSLSGDVRFIGDEFGDDYDLPCHSSSLAFPEVAFILNLTETQDVTLTAHAEGIDGSNDEPYLAIVDNCASPTVTDLCEHGSTGGDSELYARNLPAGNYFVLLEAETSSTTSPTGAFTLDVRIDPASGSSPGDDCNPGIPIDITSGAQSIDLSTLLATPDAGEFCRVNGVGYRDLFFQFTLTATQDVTIRTDGGGVQHWSALSSTCGDVFTDYDCMSGTSGMAQRTFQRLAPGTYFVNVSTFTDTGTITAEVVTASPSPTPVNELCSGATTITSGSSTTLDLTSYLDDATHCSGAEGYLDAYYTFTLTEQREVSLSADGARRLAILDSCGTTTPICSPSGSFPPSMRRVLDAGTYVIAVEADPFTASTNARLLFSTFAP